MSEVTRNIKIREGYEFWDKLCAIPRYGFIKSPLNAVVKVEGLGNWIERDEAQRVMDDAQSEVNELRARVAELERDAERLNFMLSERCLVDSQNGNASSVVYRICRPDGWRQSHWYPSEREAIDAAMAKGE